MIERIKNSDRNARRGGIDRKKKEGVREGFHRKAERRVLERRVAGLTFGRGRRKRNQLVVRFRNTDLLASPVYHYRKTLDDPSFFRFTGVKRMVGEGATVCATLFLHYAASPPRINLTLFEFAPRARCTPHLERDCDFCWPMIKFTGALSLVKESLCSR